MLQAFGHRKRILESGLFDASFYLDRYPDVAAANLDPIAHYLKWGAKEGRRPHPAFDPAWYLRTNQDVAKEAGNPLLHYLTHGKREGRRPHKGGAVYTAIIGPYDHLRAPLVVDPDLDYFVFTDSALEAVPEPWIVRRVSQQFANSGLTSRFIKSKPHLHLPEYEISLWVDGAYCIRGVTLQSLEENLADHSIAAFPHPWRDCAYAEAEVVRELGRDSAANVDRVVEKLTVDGFPRNAGLTESGCIIRRHRDNRLKRAMDRWWDMIVHGSSRDQLSLSYVLWKEGISIRQMDGHSRRNKLVYWMGHRAHTLADMERLLAEKDRELLELYARLEN